MGIFLHEAFVQVAQACGRQCLEPGFIHRLHGIH